MSAIEPQQDMPTLPDYSRGLARPAKAAGATRTSTTESSCERRLVIASRMAPGYQLSEFARKHLQHVLTDWFPRAVYRGLTPDTARVEVVIRKSFIVNRNVYTAAFMKIDGSVIKTIDYEEDTLMAAKCPNYDQVRSAFCGTKDGADFRLAIYNTNEA